MKEKVVNFNPEQSIEQMVRDIFNRRAKKQKYSQIAKAHGIPEHTVGDILHRKSHKHVTIPHDILVKVADQFRKPYTQKPKQVKPKMCRADAISKYTAAAVHLFEAEQDALEAGINKDTLDMLRMAVRGDD